MKKAPLRLTQRQAKRKQTGDIKQTPFSLTSLKDSVANYWNRGLAITAEFLHNLRTDESKPKETKGITKGANLSVIPCSRCHPRGDLRNSPKLSLDEKIDITRKDAMEREEMNNTYRVHVLDNRNPMPQCNEAEKEELGEEPKELQIMTASPAVNERGTLSKEIRERNQNLRDKFLAHAEKRRRMSEISLLAARKIYEKRYKPRVPETPVVQGVGDGYRRYKRRVPNTSVVQGADDRYRLRVKEEAERRRRNWLAQLPRTADGKLFAYGCGKRRKEFDWEAEWEKRRTPCVCGKRKRQYSFTASLEEPKRQKRKIRAKN